MLLFLLFFLLVHSLDYAIVSDQRIDLQTYYYPQVTKCIGCNVSSGDRIIQVLDPKWQKLNVSVSLYQADGSLVETCRLAIIRPEPAIPPEQSTWFHWWYATIGCTFIGIAILVGLWHWVPTQKPKATGYLSEKQKDNLLAEEMGLFEV